MSTVDAALAAMDEAEQEARDFAEPTNRLKTANAGAGPPPVGDYARLLESDARTVRWARDRLRLIQRDRVTLERHRIVHRSFTSNTPTIDVADWPPAACTSCHGEKWPCLEARAVIDHWQEDA